MIRPLAELIEKSHGGGTPSRSVPQYWNGSIPWASVKDFPEGKTRLNDTLEHITPKGLRSSAARIVSANIPVVCVRMAVGRVAAFDREVAINQDLRALYPTGDINPAYFLKQLAFSLPCIERLTTGTTVKGLSTADLYGLRIYVPADQTEQAAIVSVLDAADEAIAKTEALIAKLKAIKQGLLHDLLTRGLDDNGELRDPEKRPGLFKQSVLGLIPGAWNVFPLSSVATLQRGFDLPLQRRRPGSVPIYGSNGVDGWHNESRVTGPGVITGRSGSIGFVYYSESDFWPLNTTLYVKDFHGNEPRFVRLLLESLRLERFGASTGVPSLNRNFVHPTRVAVPPFEEQVAIVSLERGLQTRIDAESEYLAKLRAIKKGLMQDLLTGRVRVPAGRAPASATR